MIELPHFYLGPVSYYSRIYRALITGNGYRFDSADLWQKQTLRSRCYIASSQGRMMLSIPVSHLEISKDCKEIVNSGKELTDSMLLSSHGNWSHQHWNALASNYRQSPYFDYYADDFECIYKSGKYRTLTEFTGALHDLVMDCMGLDNLPAHHALGDAESVPREYYQVFRNRTGFLPDLSIVDLVFNMGPEARLYL